MADKKISQLSSASTPLAGTEVLPIVQSSTTVKVATDDLTVKNVRSNATTGILQIAGPAAAATRVMTVPDANFTSARTDAAQTFTDDQTLGTGNLVVGTAGKGINFSANTHAAGMTSELLTWYEEGTWTPTLNASTLSGAVYATQLGFYTRVGNLVTLQCDVKLSALTSGGTNYLRIEGFPFTTNASAIGSSGTVYAENLTGGTLGNYIVGYIGAGQTSLNLYEQNNTGIISANGMSGARLTATSRFIFTATYRV